jgi:hypothetical protein
LTLDRTVAMRLGLKQPEDARHAAKRHRRLQHFPYIGNLP